MVKMGNPPEPAWRDKLAHTVWIALSGDYFHRAVYMMAQPARRAAVMHVIALERAQFGQGACI